MIVIFPALILPKTVPFSSPSSAVRTCFGVSPVSADSLGTQVKSSPLLTSTPSSSFAFRSRCRNSLTMFVFPYHSQSSSRLIPFFMRAGRESNPQSTLRSRPFCLSCPCGAFCCP